MDRESALGAHRADVEKTLTDLELDEVADRIWRRDHTVWKPDRDGVADRLGWLTVSDTMRGHLADLRAFACEVAAEGTRHVVLMGMGGSSLGAEVLGRTFGPVDGYPELLVLDSTAPAAVQAVSDRIDPSRTLFLVSSKSGTSIEPNAHYRYFRHLVDELLGSERAGRAFVAVTDPGTPLERLGSDHGFRRVFLNRPDLGGRYSVLSHFGMVPASLAGVDAGPLLDRADEMRGLCALGVPARESPGVVLGATLGAMALAGRDKLTLVTSPGIDAFGQWAEQLIAESTGKDGKGIVPVVGEPVVATESYGRDRLFVYMRLDGDDSVETDAVIGSVEAAGHPVVTLRLRDRLDLGAELYRWEFGTAVAGAVLGVQPFIEPDVERSKRISERVLSEYGRTGEIPAPRYTAPPVDLLAASRPGSYVAIMVYAPETQVLHEALSALRRAITERYRIPATLGFGPRLLHSTGQLHKGGPDTGLFLQITEDRLHDIPVPGEPFTFGELVDAQALGDLMALRSLGRPVAGLSLPASDPGPLADLALALR